MVENVTAESTEHNKKNQEHIFLSHSVIDMSKFVVSLSEYDI